VQRAEVRHEAEPHERQAKACTRRRDDEVGRQREAEAGPEGRAVDRGDDRAVEAQQAREPGVRVLHALAPAVVVELGRPDAAQVAACAERAARSGEHDRPHRAVAFDRVDALRESGAHILAERVLCAGRLSVRVATPSATS
jgi:hypothetical protein